MVLIGHFAKILDLELHSTKYASLSAGSNIALLSKVAQKYAICKTFRKCKKQLYRVKNILTFRNVLIFQIILFQHHQLKLSVLKKKKCLS